MWYDVNKTLSYNCLLNFVVGQRGVGKTYSAKKRAINNYLKKREEFVYLRRYETELKESNISKFFDDIEPEFPDTDFFVKHGRFYINGKCAGYYLPLSKAAQFKSTPFPNVSLIIFDEFIIDQGLIRYLPNEVTTFNEMYSTIARLRDVPVLFLSNAITFTNPYFLYFDLSLQKDQKVLRKGDILLEVIDNPEYTQAASKTRFGKILEGTDYYKYAMENQFLRDTDTFIEKIPGAGNYLFTIRVNDLSFGVYGTIENTFWYVSEKVDKTSARVISLDVESHDTNSALKSENNAKIWFDNFRQKFYRAEVRFETMKSKNVVMPILRRI